MPTLRTLGALVVVLAIINFAAYVAIAFYLHGDAWNGYSAAGHYFLREHARYTEVTRGVYQFSWWYSLVLMVHWAFAVIICFIPHFRDKRPFKRQ
ncbi:MAG TPA: hypothetical protein VIY90_16840 [Steroidobacteraceae bacterium]